VSLIAKEFQFFFRFLRGLSGIKSKLCGSFSPITEISRRMNAQDLDVGATVPHASAWGRRQSEEPLFGADSSQARSLTVGARFIITEPADF